MMNIVEEIINIKRQLQQGGGGGGDVTGVKGNKESTYRTGNVNLTPEHIGALPDDTLIPTKTSDLVNDSNFIADANYNHTDNNYTNAEKTKLDGLENYDDTAIKNRISTIEGKEAGWDAKAEISDIPTQLAQLSGDSAHRVVSDSEKSTWNGKAEPSDIKNATITFEQGGVVKGSFSTNQGTNQTITLDGGGGGGSVTGVKGNAETTYRTGNVNLTPENIGLGNVDNTSDAEKKENFTGTVSSSSDGFVLGKEMAGIFRVINANYSVGSISANAQKEFSFNVPIENGETRIYAHLRVLGEFQSGCHVTVMPQNWLSTVADDTNIKFSGNLRNFSSSAQSNIYIRATLILVNKKFFA